MMAATARSTSTIRRATASSSGTFREPRGSSGGGSEQEALPFARQRHQSDHSSPRPLHFPRFRFRAFLTLTGSASGLTSSRFRGPRTSTHGFAQRTPQGLKEPRRRPQKVADQPSGPGTEDLDLRRLVTMALPHIVVISRSFGRDRQCRELTGPRGSVQRLRRRHAVVSSCWRSISASVRLRAASPHWSATTSRSAPLLQRRSRRARRRRRCEKDIEQKPKTAARCKPDSGSGVR